MCYSWTFYQIRLRFRDSQTRKEAMLFICLSSNSASDTAYLDLKVNQILLLICHISYLCTPHSFIQQTWNVYFLIFLAWEILLCFSSHLDRIWIICLASYVDSIINCRLRNHVNPKQSQTKMCQFRHHFAYPRGLSMPMSKHLVCHDHHNWQEQHLFFYPCTLMAYLHSG
jgi:hypothetical protein